MRALAGAWLGAPRTQECRRIATRLAHIQLFYGTQQTDQPCIQLVYNPYHLDRSIQPLSNPILSVQPGFVQPSLVQPGICPTLCPTLAVQPPASVQPPAWVGK